MSYPTYGLDFETLRDANVKRCEQSFHPISDWSACDWMTAACGELGEAANLIKKLRRLDTGGGSEIVSRGQGYESAEQITPMIAQEIADTVIYLDLLAARLGIDLGDAVREKFNIVSERVGSEVTL